MYIYICIYIYICKICIYLHIYVIHIYIEFFNLKPIISYESQKYCVPSAKFYNPWFSFFFKESKRVNKSVFTNCGSLLS